MTDEQFVILLNLLSDIKNSIENLRGEPNAKNKYDLSDISSDLGSVTSAVEDVERAVKEVKDAVNNLDIRR